MPSRSQTPLILQAFIAVFLVVGSVVTLVTVSFVLYHMLTHPPPAEPHYIYEPKPVKKW